MKKYTAKSLHPDSSELNHGAYKRGCVLFKNGAFDKAKLAFEEALEYWPKDSQAWMALGNCEDELNKPKLAEASFRRALQYCEENRSAIRFNLANSLFDQERYIEAIKLYEQIPEESNVHAVALRNLSAAKRSLSKGSK